MPGSRVLSGPCMGSTKYHYHYNELHPSHGVQTFFLYPGKERLTRVRANLRLVSCHEEIRGITIF